MGIQFGKVRIDGVLATPFTGTGSAVNTGAAAIVAKAAVTGKRHWVTHVQITNKTAGEYPVCELTEDALGTPVIKDTLIPMPVSSASMGSVERFYNPPIEITAAKTIGYQHQSATGDTYITVQGYVED